MSNSDSTKRLSLLLTLNPGLSDADRYAIETLKLWYRDAKRTHTVAADLEASVTRFHRDIYLSGLFLHLLDRTLPGHLSDALTSNQISTDTLMQFLQACGQQPNQTARFSDDQLAQLQEQLQQQTNSSTASTKGTDPQLQSLLQQILSMQQAQMSSLQQLQRHGLHAVAQPEAGSLRNQEQGVLTESNVADKIEQVQKVKQKGIF